MLSSPDLERVGLEARHDAAREELAALESESVGAPTDGVPAPSVTEALAPLPKGPSAADLVRALERTDALLASLPASRVLERSGLEERRDELVMALRAASSGGQPQRTSSREIGAIAGSALLAMLPTLGLVWLLLLNRDLPTLPLLIALLERTLGSRASKSSESSLRAVESTRCACPEGVQRCG